MSVGNVSSERCLDASQVIDDRPYGLQMSQGWNILDFNSIITDAPGDWRPSVTRIQTPISAARSIRLALSSIIVPVFLLCKKIAFEIYYKVPGT